MDKNNKPTLMFKTPSFKLTIIALFISSATIQMAQAAEDYFNPAILTIDGDEIADLSVLEYFSMPGGQLPGRYPVTIYVNNARVGTGTFDFVSEDSKSGLMPVLTKEELTRWGVLTNVIPDLKDLPDSAEIINIGQYIEYAKTRFVFNKQALYIDIPQIAMDQHAQGYVDPATWDQGITALSLDYHASGSQTWVTHGDSYDDQFLSLRSGLNIGAWRLTNYSVYSNSSNGNSNWNNINTYLERDVQPLKSQLVAGDISTGGQVVSSFSFRGVKMYSDLTMLPSSQRSFAPTIRGFANSNATITVRQNGNILYQTYVAAGPFVINDLGSTGNNGNLEVTVSESDGSENTFMVPYSTLAIMQREGQIKYSTSVGKYRGSDADNEPYFIEGEVIYGLPLNMTVFGGGILSKDYQSGIVGMGLDLGYIGAISADISHARAIFEHDIYDDKKQSQGQSYRFQYSKSMLSSGTTVTLAAYRYSTSGYYDFSEANGSQVYDNYINDIRTNKRARWQLSLSQNLGSFGSVYASFYQQDYWNLEGKERTINLGYNFSYAKVNYGISYFYSKTPTYDSSQQLYLSVSMSLGDLMGTKNNFISTSINNNFDGQTNVNTSLNGSMFEDNSLSYSISESYSRNKFNGNSDTKTSGNASVTYRSSLGTFNTAYGYSKNSQRVNYSFNGSVFVHPYGVTFGPSIGSTKGIIVAPGAAGARVGSTQLDSSGIGIISSLAPYTNNRVSLNINDMASNVEIVTNDVNLVPTRGAVVVAKFETRVGYRVMMHIKDVNGKNLPFASVVSMDDLGDIGIVGDDGEAYMSGMPAQGSFKVQWGSGAHQSCTVDYTLPIQDESEILIKSNAVCI